MPEPNAPWRATPREQFEHDTETRHMQIMEVLTDIRYAVEKIAGIPKIKCKDGRKHLGIKEAVFAICMGNRVAHADHLVAFYFEKDKEDRKDNYGAYIVSECCFSNDSVNQGLTQHDFESRYKILDDEWYIVAVDED